MNKEDLRKLLETSNDRYNILKDLKKLIPYNINLKDLRNFIIEFLTDEEKVNILDVDYIKLLDPNLTKNIIKSIKNNDIKLRTFEKQDIMSRLEDYEIVDIVETLDDIRKVQLLKGLGEIYKDIQISEGSKYKIIMSLDNNGKKEILSDTNLTKNILELQDLEIINIICKIEDDEDKLAISNLYKYDAVTMFNIIDSLSDERKKQIILENPYNYKNYTLASLMKSLSVENLVNFFEQNSEFMKEKDIKIHEIVKNLNIEKQMEFISIMDNLDISLDEKRKIFISLREETKQKIDKSKLAPEYAKLLEIKINRNIIDYGKIIIDFSKDMEIYRGLDELISINALEIKEEDKEKFFELCEICPNMKITDNLIIGISTVQEYKNSEKWIESVLQGINPEWRDIEKIAFIDNEIGKKISYSPDFGTEMFDHGDARALWKIVDSGYGVCNGIAQLEQYMLKK